MSEEVNTRTSAQAFLDELQKQLDSGKTEQQIAETLSLSVSELRSTRAVCNQVLRDARISDVAETLRSNVEDKGFVDVGFGAGVRLGVSQNTLQSAVNLLKDEGYVVHITLTQLQNMDEDKKTTIKVLAAAGTTYKDVVNNRANIKPVTAKEEATE